MTFERLTPDEIEAILARPRKVSVRDYVRQLRDLEQGSYYRVRISDDLTASKIKAALTRAANKIGMQVDYLVTTTEEGTDIVLHVLRGAPLP